jgi:hypothetical protein
MLFAAIALFAMAVASCASAIFLSRSRNEVELKTLFLSVALIFQDAFLWLLFAITG